MFNLKQLGEFDEVIEDTKKAEMLTIVPNILTSEERGIPSSSPLRDKDSIIRTDKIEFISYNKAIIPGYGDKGDLLNLSNLAVNKFGSMLGINWFKFFDPTSTANTINSAVQNHLRTRPEKYIKVVAREHFAPKSKIAKNIIDRCDTSDTIGVVRGFVGINYQEIPDSFILNQIRNTCNNNGNLDKFKIQGATFSDEISRFNIVNINGTIEKDMHLFGLSIKNSGTGYCALTANIFCFRIACLNGMIHIVSNSGKLLWQRHIGDNNERIIAGLAHVYDSLVESRDNLTNSLKYLMGAKLIRDNVEAEFKTALTGFPKKLIRQVYNNFDESEEPNRYNILQTITRTARDILSPVVRFDLEEAAGKYLNSHNKDSN